ncbi:hypothetical protein GBN23_02385 [Plesiomonas shigelloides]|nr:hypothetical protein GBN23_02385 [Plesiomonas shigelloides]
MHHRSLPSLPIKPCIRSWQDSCRSCSLSLSLLSARFQLTYTYEVRKLSVKDKIVEMVFNGAGVRNTARVLQIGINTFLRTPKNSRQGK